MAKCSPDRTRKPSGSSAHDGGALDVPAGADPTLARWSGTVDGNHLTIIGSGSERLDELLRLIGSARRKLRLLFYIFLDDRAGTCVMDALVAAAERGVDVVLMYDCFGSNEVDDGFFDRLRSAGGTARAFSRRWRPTYLIRNHQKLVIADDDCAMSGGFNIADDYFGDCADDCWQDLGFLLSGPAVADAIRYFDSLYHWLTLPRRKLRSIARLIHSWNRQTDITHETNGGGVLTWLVGGPTRKHSPLERSLRRDLAQSRRMDMIMAYFAPPIGLMRRTSALSRRGRVRLLMAGKSDNGATIGAARILYGPLLKRGAEILEFQPRKLHTKLIVIDDIVYLGSANFDVRSTLINLELDLRIEDAALAAAMRALVDAYAADSIQITPAAHRCHLTLFNRLRWSLSYLMVGVLDYGVTRRLNFGIR